MIFHEIYHKTTLNYFLPRKKCKYIQYFVGNSGKNQLYVGYHTYHPHRPNYWKCSRTSCKVTIATRGDQVKVSKQWLRENPEMNEKSVVEYLKYIETRHNHDTITPQQLECQKSVYRMKQKVILSLISFFVYKCL